MKYIIPVFASLLILSGCNDLEGNLVVHKDFSLQNTYTKDDDTLKEGNYRAKLGSTTFGRFIRLSIKGDLNSGYDFAIPKKSIPENGPFTISAKDLKQNVSLAGNIKTDVKDTDIREVNQDCTYYRQQQVCTNNVCHTVSYPVAGHQWVRFYDHFVDQSIDMMIDSADGETHLANFNGGISTVQRINVSETTCW
jgi:hypothetical protein